MTKNIETPLGSAYGVNRLEDRQDELYFWVREEWESKNIPNEQTDLMYEFEKVAAVLKARFKKKDPDKFEAYFDRLLKLAQMAFNSKSIQLYTISKSIEQFKSELIQSEGPQVKHDYSRELIISVIIALCIIMSLFFLIPFGFFWLLDGISISIPNIIKAKIDENLSFLNLGILLCGTMLGIWLSFVTRTLELSFEQLQNPDSDLIRPWIRLLAYGLFAFMLALFFYFEVIVISVGDGSTFSTNLINDNTLVACFFGLCLGFVDKLLPTIIKKKVREFILNSSGSKTNND